MEGRGPNTKHRQRGEEPQLERAPAAPAQSLSQARLLPGRNRVPS